MRGISAIVSILILLLITISLAGAAYTYISTYTQYITDDDLDETFIKAQKCESVVILSDVQIGDPSITYDNIEFSRDMQWATVLEEGSLPSRRKIWLSAMDPDTGDMVPPDGHGLLLDEVSALHGLAYFGEDIGGILLTYVDLNGNIWEVRPKIPIETTTKATLATPADTTRSTTYPSTMPTQNGFYVTYRQEDTEGRIQVWYIYSEDPLNQHQVTQGPTTWYYNQFEVFPRWFKDRPIFVFAYRTGGIIQVAQYDVTLPYSPPTNPRLITTDAISHVDAYPFSLGGTNYLAGGYGTSQYGALYTEQLPSGIFTFTSNINPGQSLLFDPGLASSFEPFLWNGELFSVFGIHELPPAVDAARNHAGEIHLVSMFSDLLSCRISRSSANYANADPEFFLGNGRAWIFYHSRHLSDPIMQFRRMEVQIG